MTATKPLKILFLHGLEGTPTGSKPTHLSEEGHLVVAPVLGKDDFTVSLKIAEKYAKECEPDLIVGSSRGGALAAAMDRNGAKAILIAPAWKKFGSNTCLDKDTIILHSVHDDIVPVEDSRELAKKFGCTLIECGDNHRMRDVEAFAFLDGATETISEALADVNK